tara:strand:+ start:390 stop:803 length:414 start_codon:yes stop_codon:yes gene_type:complete
MAQSDTAGLGVEVLNFSTPANNPPIAGLGVEVLNFSAPVNNPPIGALGVEVIGNTTASTGSSGSSGSDVITSAHRLTATIVNGAAIVSVKKTGDYESFTSSAGGSDITTLNVPSGTMSARLGTRLDDVRCYTGDSAS